MLKYRKSRGFFVGLICTLSFLFASCEKKTEENKQKSLDMITVRTLGLAYLEENNLEEAEEKFRELIEIAPDEALGHANLSLVYMRMGRYTQAREQIEKAC